MTYQDALTALADPTRRQIFESLLGQSRSVSELAKSQPVSRPAVSQHLKVLQQARLVDVQPQGNRRIYSIRKEGLSELRTWLDQFWTDALQAFGAEIDRQQSQHNTQTGAAHDGTPDQHD